MSAFESMNCTHAGTLLQARVARPANSDAALPTVLVMHGGLGLDHRMNRPLQRLAEAGYLAIATDMYGVDTDISSGPAAGQYFEALLKNPDHLRERTVAWFEAVAARPDVDASRIAAIGYCFGGKCVLELARSGADLKAVVSYHGLLQTHAPAQAGRINGEVAAYCAGHDPYVPSEHIEAFRKELQAAGTKHQITIFSEAQHAFTDPDASLPISRPGVSYHPLADRISWAGTMALLDSTLQRN